MSMGVITQKSEHERQCRLARYNHAKQLPPMWRSVDDQALVDEVEAERADLQKRLLAGGE